MEETGRDGGRRDRAQVTCRGQGAPPGPSVAEAPEGAPASSGLRSSSSRVFEKHVLQKRRFKTLLEFSKTSSLSVTDT